MFQDLSNLGPDGTWRKLARIRAELLTIAQNKNSHLNYYSTATSSVASRRYADAG